MNKKFVYQVGNNKKKLYYDARPTKYQEGIGVKACLNILNTLMLLLGFFCAAILKLHCRSHTHTLRYILDTISKSLEEVSFFFKPKIQLSHYRPGQALIGAPGG